MLYPDPKQRIVLGWRIRWIAGLFSLLMLAAGMGPAYASTAPSEAPDPLSIEACPATVSADEQLASALIDPAFADPFGFKTATEGEGEKAEDAHASPVPVSAWLLSIRTTSDRAGDFDDGSLRRIEFSGRVSPRAPPIA